MGDSDEEYDRRRRDKFARERSDYPSQDRKRELPYSLDRGSDYSNGRGGYDNRGSSRPRGDEPSSKRPRREWEGDAFDPRPVGASETPSASVNPPAIMSFKQFLATQDDSISDDQAIAKYHQYKLEHKRQQLHAFFIAHKDEEWFKLKYHPEDSVKMKEEQRERVKCRLRIFEELRDKGWLDKCSLDHTNGRNLIKFMDAVVVKLEGGTDEDVTVLENNGEEYEDTDSEEKIKQPVTVINQHDTKHNVKDNVQHNATNQTTKEDANVTTNQDTTVTDNQQLPKTDEESTECEKTEGEDGEEKIEDGEKEDKPLPKKDEEGALSDSDSESKTANKGGKESSDESKKPTMLLHKTSSIFLRNISPNVTKQEVEQLSQRFPGYLRVGLADPAADRRFYRRGWISFKRDVNIKEICWQLNNVRLRDTELGAIVNRDLTRRIRTVNGITAHKQVAQNDLRLAARLVQVYDKMYGLWQNEHTKQNDSLCVETGNPLLHNITELMIEEASAEEEELLGGGNTKEDEAKVPFERDHPLINAVDRIILYLRVVYSVDFYNHGEYSHEDEMPNRCGLIHVRGPPPSATIYGQDDTTGVTNVPHTFVAEFMKTFETGLTPMFIPETRLSDEEAVKLGKKDPQKEVEAYITANTQELAKDKWLCPLSGKKFKGPEFIRKHIENKHSEKLSEVNVEVEYFNEYIYDGKRAAAVDSPPAAVCTPTERVRESRTRDDISSRNAYDNRPAAYSEDRRGYERGGYRSGGYDNRRYDGGYNNRGYQGRNSWGSRGEGYGGGAPRRDFPPSQYNSRPPGNRPPPPLWEGRRDPREMTSYKDLDAPEDIF